MERILFKKNKSGTYDILDSETPLAIYNVRRSELANMYVSLAKLFEQRSSDKGMMEQYADRLFGYGGSL